MLSAYLKLIQFCQGIEPATFGEESIEFRGRELGPKKINKNSMIMYVFKLHDYVVLLVIFITISILGMRSSRVVNSKLNGKK
jgi:hypothetical protein